MTTCVLHQFMLNFFCAKSAFQLLFTGEVLASGIMLKEHLLVCQSEVRSQLLDTTWKWQFVSTPRWEGFCHCIKATLLDHKPYAKLICRQSLGDPQSECVGLVTFNSKPHWKHNDGIILHLRVARFLSDCFQRAPTNN